MMPPQVLASAGAIINTYPTKSCGISPDTQLTSGLKSD